MAQLLHGQSKTKIKGSTAFAPPEISLTVKEASLEQAIQLESSNDDYMSNRLAFFEGKVRLSTIFDNFLLNLPIIPY